MHPQLNIASLQNRLLHSSLPLRGADLDLGITSAGRPSHLFLVPGGMLNEIAGACVLDLGTKPSVRRCHGKRHLRKGATVLVPYAAGQKLAAMHKPGVELLFYLRARFSKVKKRTNSIAINGIGTDWGPVEFRKNGCRTIGFV